MDRSDIDKLRHLDIIRVAERLGLEVFGATKVKKCLCPFHKDTHPSMTLSPGRNTYRCFVCDASGNPIDLVMNYTHKSFHDACMWLADESNIILSQPRTEKVVPPQEFDARQYGEQFTRSYLTQEARVFLLDIRKLRREVLKAMKLRSYYDRDDHPWLQIPYFDVDGKLIGVQSRNLKPGFTEKPRFVFAPGSQCQLYNQQLLRLAPKGSPIFVAEGCSDCWALLSAGYWSIAIPSATLLKSADVQTIRKYVLERDLRLYMYPDHDVPGEKLFLQLKEQFPELTRLTLAEGCKDYSEMYLKCHTYSEQ